MIMGVLVPRDDDRVDLRLPSTAVAMPRDQRAIDRQTGRQLAIERSRARIVQAEILNLAETAIIGTEASKMVHRAADNATAEAPHNVGPQALADAFNGLAVAKLMGQAQ